MTSLTAFQQRVLAFSILIGLVALVWLGLLRPLAETLMGTSEEREHSVKLLSAYRHAVESRPLLEAQMETLKKQEATVPGIAVGSTSAVAAASLQSEIKRIIELNGGEIRSAQNLPSAVERGYEKILIRFDLSIAMKSLERLIYQLETHTPYLFIEHVDLRAPDSGSAAGQPVADPKLAIRWDVAAYRWAGS
jgi:general secretion pathway protein M